MPDDEAPRTSNPSPEWRELAAKASKEPDPEKLMNMISQLLHKMDEEELKKKAQGPPLKPNEQP